MFLQSKSGFQDLGCSDIDCGPIFDDPARMTFGLQLLSWWPVHSTAYVGNGSVE
jgi:hypothetical protein